MRIFLLFILFFFGFQTMKVISQDIQKRNKEKLWEQIAPFFSPPDEFQNDYGDAVVRTPNIDKLAKTGVVYDHAFANAPVCVPARSTIITGMYANSLETHQMRSNYKVPEFVRFFPEHLREEAGYYTTNSSKEDYNTSSTESLLPEVWNESSDAATYKNRKPGQPFFHVQNYDTTHESSLFDSIPDDQLDIVKFLNYQNEEKHV